MSKKENRIKKVVYMILGIVLIGVCVGSYRMAGFGVDPFSCMDLGISTFLRGIGLSFMTFGNWQLIMNCLIFVAVVIMARHFIGIGTFVNMIFVGYIADFMCWILQTLCHIPAGAELVAFLQQNMGSSGMAIGWMVRILFLIAGTAFCAIGVAMYMVADWGIAPYDAVAYIIEDKTNKKVPFKYARIISDCTVTVIGIVFCAMSGNSILLVVGVGTIINAFFIGPLVQFFKDIFVKTL